MPSAASEPAGARFKDIFPGGFDKKLGLGAGVNQWSSISHNAGHSMFSTEHLYYSLIEREDPKLNPESIIVKTAWYGKQTKAPQHEFIIVQVEDITEPKLTNYLVLDRNAGVPHAKSATVSLAASLPIYANDTFKVAYDGDAKKLLKECRLTPNKYLEALSFQSDAPLYLYELVALAKFVNFRYPNYAILDSSCYLFGGVVWDCLRRMRPSATYLDDLASRRGQCFCIRYTPNASAVQDAHEHVQARIFEIELIFRSRRETQWNSRTNQSSEKYDYVHAVCPPSGPPLSLQASVPDARQLGVRFSTIHSLARLFVKSRYSK